jgi:hypothetical protein
MADFKRGLKGLFRRCTATTKTSEVWVAVGVVFLVLGVMGSGAYLGLGAAFLAIGLARRHRRSVLPSDRP